MRLFKEDNFQVVINPEAKLIPEFKKIITNDKDRKKRNAHKHLAYIYFICDYRSPIRYIPKEKENKDFSKTYTLTINVQSPNSYAMGWISTMSYNVPSNN